MTVDLQFLEVCLGHRRGSWNANADSTSQSKEESGHRCCGRVGQVEQSLSEMVNLHWTLARQGNDFRSHMDNMTRRIQQLETGNDGCQTGEQASTAKFNSRELSLAMPIIKMGGDLGMEPMTPPLTSRQLHDIQ